MASNKTGMTDAAGRSGGSGLGGTLLTMLAAGVAGGALLIAGAKTAGDKMLEKQESDERKLGERREADKEEVRRITENETETGL